MVDHYSDKKIRISVQKNFALGVETILFKCILIVARSTTGVLMSYGQSIRSPSIVRRTRCSSVLWDLRSETRRP